MLVLEAEKANAVFDLELTMSVSPDVQPVADRDSGELKLVDGEPVYSIRVSAIVVNVKNGKESEAPVYLKVKQKPAVLLRRTPIELVGAVDATPFVQNGRLAWSLTADGVQARGSKGGER